MLLTENKLLKTQNNTIKLIAKNWETTATIKDKQIEIILQDLEKRDATVKSLEEALLKQKNKNKNLTSFTISGTLLSIGIISLLLFR